MKIKMAEINIEMLVHQFLHVEIRETFEFQRSACFSDDELLKAVEMIESSQTKPIQKALRCR